MIKRACLSVLIAASAINFSYAQNTPWSTSGSIGIGTSSPSSTFQVIPGTGNGVVIGNTSYPSWMGDNGLYSIGVIRGDRMLLNTTSSVAWGDGLTFIGGYSNGSIAPYSYLTLNTSNTERVRLDNNGNFGIGTPTPSSILSVATGGNSYVGISGNNYNSLVGDLSLSRTNTADQLLRSTNIALSDGNGTSFIQTFQGQLEFWSYVGGTASENMRILSNGNVGIGTSSPLSALQVNEGSSKLAMGDAGGAALNYGTSYIGFNAARYNNSTWRMETDGGNDGGSAIFGDIFGNLNFATLPSSNGSNYYELTDAQVASAVSFQITSSGVTHAKQIVVNLTGWPDYVFKPAYSLPSLNEIKTYIDKNHHLPEMPSEAEVAKDGVNVGNMDKLLTKKVEELTLYLIEKDKQIKAEEDKNRQLSEKLTALEKRLSAIEQKLN